MMLEEKKNSYPDGQEPSSAAGSKSVGSGTPLRDDLETPLYVSPDKYESVIGIGPGTPLKDPENVVAVPAPVSTPPPVSAPAPAESTLPEASVPVSAPEDALTPEAETPEEGGEDDFAKEMEQAMDNGPEMGEIVKGRVLRIDAEDVIVDIGYKSEGIISREEFLDAGGNLRLEVGDEIEVLLERRENREGLTVLSKRKVDRRRGWEKANHALANNLSVEGLIFSKCKGGFMVDLGGVEAFLPGSQVDIRSNVNPDSFLQQRYQFKVIKINRARGNIVVSRRNHLAETRQQQRSEALAKVAPGRMIRGVVKNITHFGAFVDVGGVDALLHVNDMAWSKVTNPHNVVKVGDQIEALVLSVDETNGRIALGFKQKSEDPWVNMAAKYPTGSTVEGEVVTLTDFGAFLRLEEGVEGLLPVSEMSWSKRIRHPKEVLKVGDSVRVKVLALDPSAKRITLGLRQTEPDPFTLYISSQKVGNVVEGVVRSLARYGAFVELAEGVSGLLHVSDLSWDSSLKQPEQLLKVGDSVRVKILEIQADKKKIALGLKQMGEDPWAIAAKRYAVGSIVEAKVIRNTKFGVFVQLQPGIEGLIHVSQLEREKGQNDPQPLAEGQLVQAKVVKINPGEHKIGLSIREFVLDQEAAEMRKYMSPDSKPGISLGEISGLTKEELLKRFNSPNGPRSSE